MNVQSFVACFNSHLQTEMFSAVHDLLAITMLARKHQSGLLLYATCEQILDDQIWALSLDLQKTFVKVASVMLVQKVLWIYVASRVLVTAH